MAHKMHKAVGSNNNNNHHNSRNLHLQGAAETNNKVKGHQNVPVKEAIPRVTAKIMMAVAVMVATVVATAVGIVANPAGVQPTPTAARHPEKASTDVPGRKVTKRKTS